MLDYKILLGLIATVIGFISYLPYFRDVLKGKTKPHVFSWFVWGLLAAITFFAQLVKGGGAGAWATGMTAAIAFSIAIIAIFRGEKDIKIIDWLSLFSACIGLILWVLTSNPLLAVVTVVVADVFAFSITFRKAFYKPHEETASTFALSALKWVIALFALESFNLTTALDPMWLILANTSFVAMVLLRRRSLGLAASPKM